MKEMLRDEPYLSEEYSAGSAGISAFDGDGASRESVSVMKAGWDIDISGHRAKALTDEDIKAAYLILTMTKSHRDCITSFLPEAAEKTFTIKEYAGNRDSTDIPDPFGMSVRSYTLCASEIRQAILILVEKLKKSR